MSKFKKLNITVPANNNNKKEYENDDDSALEEDELVTCHQQHGRELNGTADQHKAVTQLKKKQNHDSATSVRMSSAETSGRAYLQQMFPSIAFRRNSRNNTRLSIQQIVSMEQQESDGDDNTSFDSSIAGGNIFSPQSCKSNRTNRHKHVLRRAGAVRSIRPRQDDTCNSSTENLDHEHDSDNMIEGRQLGFESDNNVCDSNDEFEKEPFTGLGVDFVTVEDDNLSRSLSVSPRSQPQSPRSRLRARLTTDKPTSARQLVMAERVCAVEDTRHLFDSQNIEDIGDHTEDTIMSAITGTSPRNDKDRLQAMSQCNSFSSEHWNNSKHQSNGDTNIPPRCRSAPAFAATDASNNMKRVLRRSKTTSGYSSSRRKPSKRQHTSNDIDLLHVSCLSRVHVLIVEHHSIWNMIQLLAIVAVVLDVTLSYGFPDYGAPSVMHEASNKHHNCNSNIIATGERSECFPCLSGDSWFDFDDEGLSGLFYVGTLYACLMGGLCYLIVNGTDDGELGAPSQHNNIANCEHKKFAQICYSSTRKKCDWDSRMCKCVQISLAIMLLMLYAQSVVLLRHSILNIIVTSLFWADLVHRLSVRFSKDVQINLTQGWGADADLSVYEPRVGLLVLDIVSLSDILVVVIPSWGCLAPLHFSLLHHGGAFRLLRIVNWFRIIQEEESKLLFVAGFSTHAMQFLQLLTRMFMCMHLTGCLMFAIAQFQCEAWVHSNRTDINLLKQCVIDEEIGFLDDPNIFSQSIGSRYVHGCAWALAQMTGMGMEIPNPRTAWEKVFTMTVNVVGFTLYASVAGNLMATIAVVDEDILTFREKIKNVNRFMSHHNLPVSLRERLLKYYKAQRQYRQFGLQDNHALQDLPIYLRREMQLYVNHEIISKSALFNQCSGAFASAIAGMLELQLCLARDFLIREGDLGHEMYFVRTGSLEVVKKGLGHRLAMLGPGSVIGEIAVLHEQPRSASVRALTMAHLFMLTKENFDKVSTHFPDDVSVIGEVADQRFSKSVNAIRRTTSIVKALRRTQRHDTMSSVAAILRKSSHADQVETPATSVGSSMAQEVLPNSSISHAASAMTGNGTRISNRRTTSTRSISFTDPVPRPSFSTPTSEHLQ